MMAIARPTESGEHSLRWLIATHGHSIRSFAEASGVSRACLTMAVDGAQITPSTAKKIADALGMKPEELFDFE
ncbi:MAG TPA: helix-turn-helix transcriptional regulator [Candidatus Limiplasma sp.]|nr:helix-turn-helix transcriptional regulator [Candidatus Limiplasma sp.]